MRLLIPLPLLNGLTSVWHAMTFDLYTVTWTTPSVAIPVLFSRVFSPQFSFISVQEYHLPTRPCSYQEAIPHLGPDLIFPSHLLGQKDQQSAPRLGQELTPLLCIRIDCMVTTFSALPLPLVKAFVDQVGLS